MGHSALRNCDRCGHKTGSQFCADCRYVDKQMTAGGKTADDYSRERGARRRQERADRLSMLKMAGYNTESPHYH